MAAVAVTASPVSSHAEITAYDDANKYLAVGGEIQLQYHKEMPDAGETTDDLFFRRLRANIEGSMYSDWMAKIQFDLGEADVDDQVKIKDAYFQYMGWTGMKLIVGNAKFPFSRVYLTSSKHRQLVERPFVGLHNYGTPERNLGLHLRGKTGSSKVSWGASASVASEVPDNTRLDFASPVNNRGDDWSDGFMAGGRIDWHPFGYMKFSMGDFNRTTRATVGVAAFTWNNDNDNLSTSACTTDCDVKDVTGIEISGAFRGAGISIDAEYNSFDAETVQPGITDGIYKNGKTTLSNASIEGGYMFAETIELVACYETQDADGYATAWNRVSVGANWFINRHDTKLQFTYRMGENLDGVENNDEDEVFLQTQFVF